MDAAAHGGPEEVKASLTWSETLVTLFAFLILLRTSRDVSSPEAPMCVLLMLWGSTEVDRRCSPVACKLRLWSQSAQVQVCLFALQY